MEKQIPRTYKIEGSRPFSSSRKENMKILGYDYEIICDGDVDLMGSMGRFHCKNQKLQIATDICGQEKISTILHEIIEAINYHLNLRLEHNIIMSLESALFQILTANGVDLSPLANEITPNKVRIIPRKENGIANLCGEENRLENGLAIKGIGGSTPPYSALLPKP